MNQSKAMNEERFAISGMTCQACANRLEKVLNKNPAVESAQVNFATETLKIRYHDADSSDVMAWIKKTGFAGELIHDAPKLVQNKDYPYRLMLLWLLSLPFWVGMLGMALGSHALMLPVWAQFLLASVVQFGFGWHFYRGAWSSIRGGLANMDVLVALGTTSIWAYSTYAWLAHGGHAVYFEASVMVIAFVSLGKYLEMRTKQDSLNSLSLLMNLIPETALSQKNGAWQKVSVPDIQVSDVLLAKVGERIAVDGVLTVGFGLVDEAHLTGESAAISKAVGDKVLAGSIVIDGGFEYQAVATGERTALGDMIAALDEAQGSKANIARLTDKVAGIFVPAVVVISFLTLLGNWLITKSFDVSLMRAVAVLVIACPCALGLATPAAIMAGMGVAAKYGVRFKDAPSLEMAGRIDTMVFDKTGTLTAGRPSVRAVSLMNHASFDRALVITASLEQYATHPLANSLVKLALDEGLILQTANNITTTIGQGLTGEIDGVGVAKVGTPKFIGLADFDELLKNKLIDFKGIYPKDDDNLANIWQIASLVAMSVNDVLMAVYALTDEPKKDTKTIVEKLHKDGINTIIMSGDHQGVVDDVATRLGIKHAYGQLSPRDKSLKINELKNHGSIVCMVGDGVNDAPAMAAAQASFSVHDASSAAKYAASAELMGNSFAHVYHAQKIAKATLNNIKQNLFFAFFYNIIGIAFAAVGLLSPVIAAAAMALSSVSVLTNALRLKKLKL